MTIADVSHELVRFYNDGIEFPSTPTLIEAERAYRNLFAEAATAVIFPELRPILDEAFEIFGDKSEYVVAAPQHRAAANTAMGWKNSNLRTEMKRLLRRAGVSGWPRLFHTV
jgi:hypothetical protein